MKTTPIKALVVDDDRDFCEIISCFLKGGKYMTTIAFNGKAAIKMMKKEPYGVMILDHNLYGITGLTVLKETQKLNPSLKTIMISACHDESIKAKARELGAYAFLDKPFNIDELVNVMRTL